MKNNKDLVKVLWYDWEYELEPTLKLLKEEDKINYDKDTGIIIIKEEYCNEVINKIKLVDSETDLDYWTYDLLNFFISYFECSEESITSFFLNKTISLDIHDIISGIDDGSLLTDEVINNLLKEDINKTLKELLHNCYVNTFETILDSFESEIKTFKLTD